MIRTLSVVVLLIACCATRVAEAQCRYTSTLRCGSSVSDRLENATCAFTNTGGPYHAYFITASAGTVLDVFLTSSSFPPLLAIYYLGDEDANPEAMDDGTSIARITYDVPRSGDYQILVTANGAHRRGLFELDVFCDFVCVRPFSVGGIDRVTIDSGSRATVRYEVDGSPPLSWRWYDAANPSVTLGTSAGRLTTPQLFATTTINVAVTNACGTLDRRAAVITVNPCTAPTITVHPVDWSRSSSDIISFTVIAAGSLPFTYQWYEGDPPHTSRPVPNSNSSTIIVPPPARTTSYWARVSNGCGYADSVAAVVEVPSGRRRAVRH